MDLKQDLEGGPMARLGMDMQGPFPESMQGNRWILVVQDYFSKWVELFPLPHKDAESVARTLHDEILTRYGSCYRLHADKGGEFNNSVMDALCRDWGIKRTRTSGYAPWSNGLVERSNRSIKELLTQACQKRVRTWDTHLPKLRMALNNVPHSTTGVTPYKVWFSRCEDAFLPVDTLTGRLPPQRLYECSKSYVNEQVRASHEIHELVRQHSEQAARLQAASRRRGGLKIRAYKRGDMVWRFYPPHSKEKLNPEKWMGPYRVEDVDNTNHNVKILIPSSGRGGPLELTWVHTSNVKPAHYTKSGKMFQIVSPDNSWSDSE